MLNIKNVVGAALISPPGGGKDATGKRMAKILGPVGGNQWSYHSIGTEVCRKKAAEYDMSIERFNRKRDEDANFCPTFDNDVDEASLTFCHDSVANGRPFIITSRMVPALLHLGLIRKVGNPERIIRILYTCERHERIVRIVKREFQEKHQRMPSDREISDRFDEAEDRTMTREALDAARYKKLYGIADIYHPSYFNGNVIDTTGMDLDTQVERTRQLIVAHL